MDAGGFNSWDEEAERLNFDPARVAMKRGLASWRERPELVPPGVDINFPELLDDLVHLLELCGRSDSEAMKFAQLKFKTDKMFTTVLLKREEIREVLDEKRVYGPNSATAFLREFESRRGERRSPVTVGAHRLGEPTRFGDDMPTSANELMMENPVQDMMNRMNISAEGR